jgi:hypothetical protein
MMAGGLVALELAGFIRVISCGFPDVIANAH